MKMHVLSGGRLRMHRHVYVPTAPTYFFLMGRFILKNRPEDMASQS